MRLAFLCLLTLSTMVASAQQAPASLSGLVLEANTGKPIKGAEVTIENQSSIAVKTDTKGRFVFESLPPAAYNVRVSKGGYLPNGGRFNGRGITLGAGENVTDFVFRMQGTGTVSGRIVDFNGRPVPQASVSVFRFAYLDSQQQPSGMHIIAARNTDDHGEFRIFDVPFGVFLVVANPPASSSTLGSALYPGEREISRAQSIEVLAGEETGLRDLTLPPAMRGAIRLHIVNATGGSLPQDLGSRIAAVPFGFDVTNSPSTAGLLRYGTPPSRPADREVWPNLVGPYAFYTAMQTAVGNVAGYLKVDYSGADVDADFVVGKLEGQIKGRVLLESASGSLQPLAGAEIEFFGASAESNFSRKDGAFAIDGVLSGPYHFSGAFEMPTGYYVSSIREQDRDLLREALMVSSGTPEVEVRVRADGGVVSGIVTDSRARMASAAVVALVPQSLLQDRTDRRNTYRVADCGMTGVFELRDIIPGDYQIYAWSDVPKEAVMDPWFIQSHAGKGLPVRVEPGSRLKMDLRVLDE